MPLLRQAVKRLVAYGAAVIVLCLPAWSETPNSDVEKREVGTVARSGVIPVAANSPGRFGAHFKTRVVIFNPTSRDYSITAVLYGGNGEVGRRVISMDANMYRGYDNFLEEVFNYRGSGGIYLRAPDQEDAFYVTAEVYTDSANGRFSTTVVNGIVPEYSEGKESNYNVGIFVNRNRRTNIGVLNWGTEPSSIKAKVFDSHGMQIQTLSFELAGEAWQQKSISTPVDDGFVEWEINGESDEHYFYAVEVDNKSNDGTLTWSVQGSSSPGGGGGGTAPDLVVQAPSVSDSSLSTGASFTLSTTVRNQGNGPSAAATLRYYRSTNAIISTTDAEVGTDSVSSLSASSTSAESISLTAPSSAGTYYYGACVEPVSGESNTGNNCSSGVRVTVSGGGGSSAPDLTFTGPPRPKEITLVRGGDAKELVFTLKNIGDGPSEPTTGRAYISRDSMITRGDTEVGEFDLPLPLSPGVEATLTLTLNANANQSLGTFYAGVCVDAVAGESNTQNNCSDSAKVTVVASSSSSQSAPSRTPDGVMFGVTAEVSYQPARRRGTQ